MDVKGRGGIGDAGISLFGVGWLGSGSESQLHTLSPLPMSSSADARNSQRPARAEVHLPARCRRTPPIVTTLHICTERIVLRPHAREWPRHRGSAWCILCGTCASAQHRHRGVSERRHGLTVCLGIVARRAERVEPPRGLGLHGPPSQTRWVGRCVVGRCYRTRGSSAAALRGGVVLTMRLCEANGDTM